MSQLEPHTPWCLRKMGACGSLAAMSMVSLVRETRKSGTNPLKCWKRLCEWRLEHTIRLP